MRLPPNGSGSATCVVVMSETQEDCRNPDLPADELAAYDPIFLQMNAACGIQCWDATLTQTSNSLKPIGGLRMARSDESATRYADGSMVSDSISAPSIEEGSDARYRRTRLYG
jgi:hypothetical protein